MRIDVIGNTDLHDNSIRKSCTVEPDRFNPSVLELTMINKFLIFVGTIR